MFTEATRDSALVQPIELWPFDIGAFLNEDWEPLIVNLVARNIVVMKREDKEESTINLRTYIDPKFQNLIPAGLSFVEAAVNLFSDRLSPGFWTHSYTSEIEVFT